MTTKHTDTHEAEPNIATSLLEAINNAAIGSVAWQQAIHNAVVAMLSAEHEATKHRAK